MVGNLAGDLIKGPLEGHDLHPRVADGVRRHRRVDVLTDNHPEHLRLRSLFADGHRRYAGIVLDVLFDHFLHQEWGRLARIDREEFIDETYRILNDHPALLPRPLAIVAPRWVAADWLRVYDSMEGVDAVIQRLSQRLSDPQGILHAWESVRDDPQPLREGFLRILPDVRAALDGWPVPVA